jgi:hypothetical protein
VNGELPLRRSIFHAPEKHRYYCLDRTGQLHNSVEFQAESDEDAVAQIVAKHPHDQCEVWEGRRLVATLKPNAASNSVETSRKRLSDAERLLKGTAALVAPTSRLGRGGDAR